MDAERESYSRQRGQQKPRPIVKDKLVFGNVERLGLVKQRV